MKVGVLGGTFNPIHIGHLILADEVRQRLGLDKVFFIPAYLPAHKEAKDLLSAQERLRMVKLALKDNPYLEALDLELRRKGKSYSIDTLRALRQAFPQIKKFFFIVGSDALTYLDSWKDIDEVMKLAKFVVASRPNYPLKNLPRDILTLVIESVDISGFRLRQRLKNNESVRYYLPKEVHKYIERKGLYR
jgi:nicotinate-nucleotide adenylyltransferase